MVVLGELGVSLNLKMGLVGRSDEMALLAGFLSPGSGAKGPRALVVRGEPGTGKTALLDYAHSISEGARFRINGREALRSVALAAASQLLLDLYEDDSPASTLSLLASDLGHQLTPVQIYESVRRQLVGEKVTLLLDDLQWLDAISAGLVLFLVSAAHTAHDDLHLVIATRPSAAASSFLADLDRLADSQLLELGGLDETHGVELVRRLTGGADTESARAIWERSRGIPYWMIALSLSPRAEASGSLLEARLRGAVNDTVDALASLAVLGRPIDAAELASVHGWDHDRAIGALDDLEGRGLLGRTGSKVRLVHDLIREGVLEDMSDSSRTDAHTRVIHWLESIENPPAERQLEIIEHRLAVRLPTANQALVLASSDARLILGEDGLATLSRAADSTVGDRSEELLQAVATLASDMGTAERALDRWSIVYHHSHEANKRAWAAFRAAAAAMDLDRPTLARQWVDLAESASAHDPVVRVEGLAVTAELLMFHEQNREDGQRQANEAVALTETDGFEAGSDVVPVGLAASVKMHALQALHDVHMMNKTHDQALKVAKVMVEVAPRTSERLAAMTNVGISLRHLGRVREAASVLDSVWTELNRIALLSVAARCAAWYVGALVELGELDRAARVAGEGKQIATRLGLTRYDRLITRGSHVIQLVGGDWRGGLEALREDMADERDPHWRLALHEVIAVHLSRLLPGDSTQALAEIDRAYEDAVAANCKRCLTDVLISGAIVAARSQDAESWDKWLDRLDRTDVEKDNYLEVALAHAHALLASEPSDLRAVVEGYESLGMNVSGMWARLDLARMLEHQRRRSDTTEALRDLAADADTIGALTIRDVAEQALRQLGARTWRRAPSSDTSTLTEREREVATMVASGASNPEIAGALFLSRKTVERHVSNILAKTGSRNRTELARNLGPDQ